MPGPAHKHGRGRPADGVDDVARRLFELSTEMLAVIGFDGTVLAANPAWTRRLGWSTDELLRRPYLDLVHPDDIAGTERQMAGYGDGSFAAVFENRLQHKDGGFRRLAWRAAVDAEAGRVYASLSDVTEESRQKAFGQAIEQISQIGSWEYDFEAGAVFWSPVTHQIHETDPEQYRPSLEQALGFFPREAQEPLVEAMGRLMAVGEPYALEVPFVSAKDRRRWVRVTARSDIQNGKVTRIFGTFEDITERRQSEFQASVKEARLRAVIDGTNVGTWEWNVQTGEQVINERWAGMLGYAAAELQPLTIETFERLVHPDDEERHRALLQRHIDGEIPYFEAETRLRHRDGHWVWVQTRGRVASRTADGAPLLIAGTHQDITARKQNEASIKESNDRLTAIVENVACGIGLLDQDLRYVVCNANARAMIGLPELPAPDGAAGTDGTFRFAAARGDYGPGDVEALVHDGLSKFQPGEVARVERRRPDGRIIDICATPIVGGGYVAIYTDVTESRKAAEKIAYAARHDVLTGLANRTELRACHSPAQALGGGDPPAIFVLDLDRFKAVNDTFGHAFGDRILIAVAERVRAIIRADDVVARLGGDEFAVLLWPADDVYERATTIAERLLQAICAPFQIEAREISIGVSIGIAIGSDIDDDADGLIRNADSALYKVKANGKSAFRLFDAGLAAEAAERRILEADLRLAVAHDELELHYQPIVAMAGRRVVGAEALLRWRHPLRGLIPPDRFIKIAEESGLIVGIGEWVIQQACRDAATWDGDAVVAVNVSPAQLGKGNLVEVVMCALGDSGLPAHRLELEVTETIFLSDDALLLNDLRHLHQFGVRLSLDDFGTGYSSLGYLQKLPFDKIKIDRTFIASINSSAQSAAIVCAVTNLARSLDVATTAEGVETEAQAQMLVAAGCTLAQGFLFGRPVPNAELDVLHPADQAGDLFQAAARAARRSVA